MTKIRGKYQGVIRYLLLVIGLCSEIQGFASGVGDLVKTFRCVDNRDHKPAELDHKGS
jgi:hypothetical protein